MAPPDKSQRRTLRAMGITILGVVLSVATTVGFGIEGPPWLRAGAALATIVVLVAAVKLGTSEGGRGPLTRAADWVTGQSDDE